MLTLRKVAVVGTLAAGKSTVCQFLKECGAYLVEADKIVHELLSSHKFIGQQVIELLGSEILTERKIDRKKIARKVFSNPSDLRALEKILHPAVKEEVKRLYEQIKDSPSYSFFVAEIPLLDKAGMRSFFDTVIRVEADEKIAKNRFEKDFEARLKEQKEWKNIAADYVLSNNGTLTDLKEKTYNLAHALKEKRSE